MLPANRFLLAVAAAFGGALNSVAGGGSFLTFPALIFAGIDPITANATSAAALWPASVASAFAYRKEASEVGTLLRPFAVASALGGFLGATLLLETKSATFAALVPWLLLVATLVFTFAGRLTGRAGTRPAMHLGGAAATTFQLVVAVYGGYFGGGMGILMLAAFATMGLSSMHAMNALKNVLAVLINFTAVATFVVAGKVAWEPGIVMVVSATAGGYVSARFARRLDATRVRSFVAVVAWAMTAYFFFRAYR